MKIRRMDCFLNAAAKSLGANSFGKPEASELTVTEMLEVLNCVGACRWKLLVDDLESESLSSPLSRITKSPAGMLLNVARKLPSPIDCTGKQHKTSCLHFFNRDSEMLQHDFSVS